MTTDPRRDEQVAIAKSLAAGIAPGDYASEGKHVVHRDSGRLVMLCENATEALLVARIASGNDV